MVSKLTDLKANINEGISLIEEINAISFRNSFELKDRLKIAKKHLETALIGIENRTSSVSLLKRLLEMREGEEEELVEYFDLVQPFSNLRYNFFNSYFSATWGIYDNLNFSLKRIHDLDNKIHNEFVSLLENTSPIDKDIVKELLQDYKFIFYIFYQARNSFLHQAPSIHVGSKGFAKNSVNFGYLARREMFKSFCEFAVANKQLREPSATNSLKPNSLEEDRCLLDVCLELESKVDEFASKILIISLRQKKLSVETLL